MQYLKILILYLFIINTPNAKTLVIDSLSDFSISGYQSTGDQYGIYITNSNRIKLENVKINNAETAVFIKNSDDVLIDGCTIINSDFGIRLSVTHSTNRVVINNCRIESIKFDGVSAPQRSGNNVNHHNLVISNNHFIDIGTELDGKYHCIYVQSYGYLIENNDIENCRDGNGISVRADGIVRFNRIYGAKKSGIRYYADHKRGLSPLIIESNTICNSDEHSISVLPTPNGIDDSWVVKQIHIKNNTVKNFNVDLLDRSVLFENNNKCD